MPMIDFGYNSKRYAVGEMRFLGKRIEDALRRAIKTARPNVDFEYGVTVHGCEYGPIISNMPDLNIRIDYHQEWSFTDAELGSIAEEMKKSVKQILQGANARIDDVKIRLYSRTGHKSASLP
jgi:hypothetical protein